VPGGEGAVAPLLVARQPLARLRDGERMWKAPVEGDSPIAIAKLPEALDTAAGFAWLADGSIVFTTGDTGLLMVSDQGGDPESVLEAGEKERDFHDAAPLPSGRGVVFAVHRDEGVDTLELYAGGERKQLLHQPGERFDRPAYSATGHLLYERETTNPGIWALPFSLERLEVTGKPFLVVPNAGLPSVSLEGTLVYVAGREAQQSRLAWMDRDGRRLGDIGEPREQAPQPALSRDGTRLALTVTDGGREDLWIEDLQRGSRTRLTFDDRNEGSPEWSADGQQVVYAVRDKGGQPVLHVAPTDGTGAARELGDGASPAFTPDGQGIVYAALDPKTGWDVWLRSPLDAEPRALVRDAEAQYWPRISPAGTLMAYVSSESGRDEVYLTRFPAATGKWQVSAAGGDWPLWSGDGSRLYYMQHDHAVMEVEVTTSPALSVGRARRLFTAPGSGVPRPFGWPDGFRRDRRRRAFRHRRARGDHPSDHRPLRGAELVRGVPPAVIGTTLAHLRITAKLGEGGKARRGAPPMRGCAGRSPRSAFGAADRVDVGMLERFDDISGLPAGSPRCG
jgi:Tol biopolymer transport system component